MCERIYDPPALYSRARAAMCSIGLGICVLFVVFQGQASAAAEALLWDALKSRSAFAIMRHELAPGIGDPDNFQLGDCTTQRYLSDKGRENARQTGARFRSNGITQAQVYTSAWCRCEETAKLLGIGAVTPMAALNSIFRDSGRRQEQTGQLKAWLAQQPLSPPVVLVTHQVNINALTGQFTRSGEILVVRRGKDNDLEVLGSL